MADNYYEEKLAEYDERYGDEFEDAEIPSGFEDLPDGNYSMEVTGCRLTEAKKDEHLMVEWELKVVGGKFDDRNHWDYQHLDGGEQAYRFIKKRFAMLGAPVERHAQIPSRLGEVLNKQVKIQLKTKGEYQNTYFNQAKEPVPVGSDEEEDELPF